MHIIIFISTVKLCTVALLLGCGPGERGPLPLTPILVCSDPDLFVTWHTSPYDYKSGSRKQKMSILFYRQAVYRGAVALHEARWTHYDAMHSYIVPESFLRTPFPRPFNATGPYRTIN